MAKEILIDPVTRIEGHAKITIQLDDNGEVEDALFHVTQFRGFEKFTEGRPFYEMPSLMARICGICPVSHLMASAKACDELLAVEIPETGAKLRQIMNLAQLVQSHALSFFHLSSPDLLLGFDSDPATRNIFGVIQKFPDLGMDGINLRKFGQEIIECLGGKRIHPAWVVPGGVSRPLAEEQRDQILATIPAAKDIAERTLAWYKDTYKQFQKEISTFANFQTLFMALVNEEETLEVYDGDLRFIDADGNLVRNRIPAEDYQEFIAEAVEPHSYLKSPYYKPLGYPDGIYRVGPLARLNMCRSCGTPRADEELEGFRDLSNVLPRSSFHYHYARLVEIMYGIEKIEELLNDPEITSDHVRAHASANSREGVGISEAPRGTLMHHYRIDKNGLIEWANLIIATGHNNLAMNRGVKQVAKHFVKNDKLQEGMLNRVEAVIRTYDPCLSCSTHAVGQMPMHLELVRPSGEVIDEMVRG